MTSVHLVVLALLVSVPHVVAAGILGRSPYGPRLATRIPLWAPCMARTTWRGSLNRSLLFVENLVSLALLTNIVTVVLVSSALLDHTVVLRALRRLPGLQC